MMGDDRDTRRDRNARAFPQSGTRRAKAILGHALIWSLVSDWDSIGSECRYFRFIVIQKGQPKGSNNVIQKNQRLSLAFWGVEVMCGRFKDGENL